jgi:hypothetical protein
MNSFSYFIIAAGAPLTATSHLATACNYILEMSLMIGVIRSVFAVLGANHSGRWDQAREKIGANFLLILGPVVIKTIWVVVGPSLTTTGPW